MQPILKRLLAPVAALAAMVALSGCVAYPVGGYGYGGGYYGAPVVVAPVPIYGGWGGGWGGRGRWH